MAASEGHRSVTRALHALEVVVAAEEGVSLGDLAARVGAAKSSLHPILRAMVARGYLAHEDNRYLPGPAVASLGVTDHPSLVPVTRPHMVRLRERFDETVMLGSMVGETLVYLHTEESRQMVRYSPLRVRPPTDHPSSIGKLYLAQLDPTELEARLPLSVAPEKRDALRQDVATARRTGLAYNHGDTFPDLSAVAAPITSGGALLACLAIGGPTRRIAAQESQMADALLDVTAAVSSALA